MSTDPPLRVLVVDDSAFARKVLRTVLTRCAQIEVVGTARDGIDALEQIDRLKPDVVTLDLLMPNLDGVGVIRAAPAGTRFVVVSVTGEDSEHAVEALSAGAISLVPKPTSLATDRLYEVGADLVREVIAAAVARPPAEAAALAPKADGARVEVASSGPAPGVIVLGTSTGGPQALAALLPKLPGDLASPIAVALHIPPGYTTSLARRIDEASALRVVEATNGMALAPGMVAIAPGGGHIAVVRDGEGGGAVVRLDREAPGALHRPSVDLLFRSAAESFGASVMAVVLTGMGDDGLAGARTIRGAGGLVVAEAESSCVVYGMPRVVVEANLASATVPLEEMAVTLTRLAGRRARAA